MSATALSPGPRYPRALQTLGWVRRPGPFMQRCRKRYGDVLTFERVRRRAIVWTPSRGGEVVLAA